MQQREFLILCGGAKLSTKNKAWQKAPRVVLDAPLKPGGNVNLKIGDLTRRFAANLPGVVVDVLEMAAYVYCADQATRRGGKAEFEYGTKWRRHFRLEIPVRRPDVWGDPAVRAELARTLEFLSDDDYEFGFVPHVSPPEFMEYLPFDAPGQVYEGPVDTVMMFSGGLDSMAGAVEEIFTKGHRPVLVSHRPVSKIDNRQRELADLITARVSDPRRRPLHVSVWANKEKQLGKEYTQRTRSFLFGSFGLAVASVFGLNAIHFYENGVVSLNLPVCAQVLGGRASRTTHPQSLWRMQSLFSRIVGKPFRIENPFLWKTKTDVTAGVLTAGHAHLIAHTVSCAHTWETTKEHPHCGKCSQCIDRKLAALAAGLTNAQDPDSRYKVPVLTGAFDGVEHQTMVERVIGTAYHVAQLRDPSRLYTEYGEASRVLRYLGVPTDEAARRVFELYKTHAEQVRRAVSAGCEFAAPPHGRMAPSNSLLCIAGNDLPNPPPPPAAAGASATGLAFAATEDHVKILRVLAKSQITVLLYHVAERAGLSSRTVGKLIPDLVRYQLANFPQGARKGAAITPGGRQFLAVEDANHQEAKSA